MVPLADLQQWLMLVWIWPVAILSQMASRERMHRTELILFSSCVPFKQLAAVWLAGVGIMALQLSGVALQYAISGDGFALLNTLIGILFASGLAMTLVAWSGTRKTFEVIYVLWWYKGPINKMLSFDFTGMHHTSVNLLYAAFAAALITLGWVGRTYRFKVLHG
ncbi:hypothetical protein [Paenibacillus sp. 481]|uniref:hypothetical protein n=1 Tax=Paenibacillus sp. 481 TaxID=2835869 RepID=UPI001E59E1BB|nr:hypothetical protein [Paenibacillus sp. 481]UHA73582.1 hypothetical protein KIK04_24085 [Paenibacillus sp. 481]